MWPGREADIGCRILTGRLHPARAERRGVRRDETGPSHGARPAPAAQQSEAGATGAARVCGHQLSLGQRLGRRRVSPATGMKPARRRARTEPTFPGVVWAQRVSPAGVERACRSGQRRTRTLAPGRRIQLVGQLPPAGEAGAHGDHASAVGCPPRSDAGPTVQPLGQTGVVRRRRHELQARIGAVPGDEGDVDGAGVPAESLAQPQQRSGLAPGGVVPASEVLAHLRRQDVAGDHQVSVGRRTTSSACGPWEGSTSILPSEGGGRPAATSSSSARNVCGGVIRVAMAPRW